MKKLILLFIGLFITVISQALTVVSTAGGLYNVIHSSGNIKIVSDITVTGTIDARDFSTMRDSMPNLQSVNLSGANIVAYTGTGGTVSTSSTVYPANEIPENAFHGKSGLSSIILPSSTTSIANEAFIWCAYLTSVTIPSSVTSIGSYAFYSCTNLSSITIPPSVTSIGDNAFYLCSSLTSINIPLSINSIGNLAFAGCTGLTSIYAYAATPSGLTSSINVFYSVDKSTCILHVPIGSKTAYQGAIQWQDFTTIEEGLPAAVNNAMASKLKISIQNGHVILTGVTVGELITVYNLQGIAIYNQKADTEEVTVSLPAHGIYVVRVGTESVKVMY